MLNKIDYAVEMLFRAKNDKKTKVLSVGCVVAFGVAVAAVTIYERILKELEQTHIELGSPRRVSSLNHRRYQNDNDYDEEDYY